MTESVPDLMQATMKLTAVLVASLVVQPLTAHAAQVLTTTHVRAGGRAIAAPAVGTVEATALPILTVDLAARAEIVRLVLLI